MFHNFFLTCCYKLRRPLWNRLRISYGAGFPIMTGSAVGERLSGQCRVSQTNNEDQIYQIPEDASKNKEVNS
jgi:hypothetical protein